MAKVILFESVYSMSGSVAPIKEMIKLAKKYNALTFVDEVHAVGLYGPTGAGYAERLGVSDQIDMITGTMGKGYGVFGGYVVGQDEVIDAIRSNAPGFIFTTSLPPAVTAAAKASINHLRHSQVERDHHQKQSRYMLQTLLEADLPVLNSRSHIVPLFIGDPAVTKSVSDTLLNEYQVYVQPINYPTVPKGEEVLRLSPTPCHTNELIDHFAQSCREVWIRHGIKMYSDYANDPKYEGKFFPYASKKKLAFAY